MANKIDYTVTRVPSRDWDNIMETVTLDGSYSDEIKEEVWAAVEKMKDFSNPWVVIKIKDDKVTAKIFNNKNSALKYIDGKKKKSNSNERYFYVKGSYQSMEK